MIAGAAVSPKVLASARELLAIAGQTRRAKLRQKAKAKARAGRKGGVARKYFVETFGCQMNFHDSERVAGLLEREGYQPTELGRRRRSRRRQHVQRARAGGRQALLAPWRDSGRDRQPCRRARHCRHRLRGAAGRAGALPRAARRSTSCVGHAEPQATAARSSIARSRCGVRSSTSIRTTTSRFRSASCGMRIRCARASRSSRAAMSSARSASCRTPADMSACGPWRTSSPSAAWPRIPGTARSSCSDRSSITTRRPTIPRAISRGCWSGCRRCPGLARIRFASPHPRHVTDRLIAAIRDLPKVCKHLHLPVQSGSNRMLQAMRRRYTREQYLELVDRCAGRRARSRAVRPT